MGLHRFTNAFCLLTPLCPEREGQPLAGGGAILSTVHILSQLWKTMHPSTQLHQRGRLPRIMETLDSCLRLRTHAVVKSPMKTFCVPKTYRPILLTLELQERKAKQIFFKKKSFTIICHLSASPNPSLVLDIMKQ